MATQFTRLGCLTMCLTAFLAVGATAQDFTAQPPRTRQMLKTARELYAKGEYDAAAQLYQQVTLAKDSLTPTEQADLGVQMQQNAAAQKERQNGVQLIDQADASLSAGKAADADQYLRLAKACPFLSATDKQRVENLSQAVARSRGSEIDPKADPATLVSKAREALKRGDVDTAEAMARQAEKNRSFVAGLAFWSDSPARVLEDVRVARSKMPKTPSAPVVGKNTDLPPTTANDNTPDPKSTTITNYSPSLPPPPAIPGAPLPPTQPVADAKTQARKLLVEGYKALEANNYDQAKAFAAQAKDLNAGLEFPENTPDKLLADVQRRMTTNDLVAGNSSDPVALLRQGRSFYLQQRYDEAERLAAQAEAQNRRYGLFEDTPKKLKDDIARARAQMDADTAAKLTVEARKQLKLGQYTEAKNLATKAKALNAHGTSIWNWSDTPDAVLRDVARLEKINPMPAAPANPLSPNPVDIAQTGTKGPNLNPASPLPPPTDSLESAQLRMQAKSKAITLIVEARNLERQGHLAEARAKAIEAQNLHAQWSDNEESPGLVLRDLDTRAAARIKSLLDQATTIVNNNPSDSSRFQKADGFLLTARRLAEAFRQDTTAIDQKIQWLALAASQSRNNSPLASNMPPLQSVQAAKAGSLDEASEPKDLPKAPGIPPLPIAAAPSIASAVTPGVPVIPQGHEDAMSKLEKARLEMRAGNLPTARKLAEDAFGVATAREEASKVLRSIDAEEHAQLIIAAQRNFQAGMDAFQHKDYRKSGQILQNVDVRLLQPDQARKVGEIIDSREMRAALGMPVSNNPGVQQVVNNTPTPAAPKSPISDIEDPQIKALKEMEKIKTSKYLDMRRAAESRSIELSKSGKEEAALEVLRDFQVKLRESGLEDFQQQTLNRPVEDRINKLRTTMAQKEIEKERQRQTGQDYSEEKRVAAKTKIQETVADLIKRGGQKYHDGQYDDALALYRKADELDHDNQAAQAGINLTILRINERASRKTRDINEANFINDLDPEEMIHPNGQTPVRMNKDALTRIIARRKDTTTTYNLTRQTPTEQMIERKLSQPITLNFQDVPLYRVLQDLQVFTGLNIVPDKAALAEANISLEQQLSLQINQISLKSALNLLLKQVKLTYVIKNEVIEITTTSEAQGKLNMRTYAIADLVVPVDDHATSGINSFEEALKRHINGTSGKVNYAPPVPYSGQGSLQFGQQVGTNNYGPGAPGGPGGVGGNWQTSRTNGSTIENLVINLITNTIAPNTWESAGGQGRIQYFPLGHALVVSQIIEVQEEVQALLNALRKLQDIQISIEMRVVSVSEKFFEKIGLDFDMNIRTPQYRQENQLINGAYAGPFNINRNLGITNVVTGLTPAGQLTPDLNVPIKSSSFDFSVPPFGGFPGTLGADGGLALGLAFLNDIQVFMFLEAAQGDQRTHVMQAPKLTVFNGQTANINVQDQMFFLTGVQIAQAGSQTFFVPQNQPFPVGVGMQVTPVVSADRRFVRLNLFPQLTNLITANIPLIPVQIPIPQLFDAPNGAGYLSGQPVIFQMFFQQPSFTQMTVNTTVNVPDGGTVLLGGMKTMAEGRNEFGPPILSKIPYLSRLFRNTAFGRESQSIMVMVTPRVIINEEIEQEILGTVPIIPR